MRLKRTLRIGFKWHGEPTCVKSSEEYEMAANGRCIERKIYHFKTISTPGSTLTQTRSFCAWFDREMQVAQNPHLDHAQSAPFVFRSTKRLGV